MNENQIINTNHNNPNNYYLKSLWVCFPCSKISPSSSSLTYSLILPSSSSSSSNISDYPIPTQSDIEQAIIEAHHPEYSRHVRVYKLWNNSQITSEQGGIMYGWNMPKTWNNEQGHPSIYFDMPMTSKGLDCPYALMTLEDCLLIKNMMKRYITETKETERKCFHMVKIKDKQKDKIVYSDNISMWITIRYPLCLRSLVQNWKLLEPELLEIIPKGYAIKYVSALTAFTLPGDKIDLDLTADIYTTMIERENKNSNSNNNNNSNF